MKPRLKSASTVRHGLHQSSFLSPTNENVPIIRAKSATVPASRRVQKEVKKMVSPRFEDEFSKINVNEDISRTEFAYRLTNFDVNLNHEVSRDSDRDSQEDGFELLESIQDLEDEGVICDLKGIEPRLIPKIRFSSSSDFQRSFCPRCQHSVSVEDSPARTSPVKSIWDSNSDNSETSNKIALFRNEPSPIWHADHAIQLTVPSPRIASPDVAKSQRLLHAYTDTSNEDKNILPTTSTFSPRQTSRFRKKI